MKALFGLLTGMVLVVAGFFAFQNYEPQLDGYRVVSQYDHGTHMKVLYRGDLLTLECRHSECPRFDEGSYLRFERWTDGWTLRILVLRYAGRDIEYSIRDPWNYASWDKNTPWN